VNVVTILGLFSIVSTYATINKLRATIHGKMVLGFASSLLCCVVQTFFHHSGFAHFFISSMGGLGFWGSLLWTLVMFFDCWWTFKFFSSSDERSKRFIFYGGFVASFLSLMFAVLIYIEYGDYFDGFVFELYDRFDSYILTMTVIFACLGGFGAFKVSKALQSSERSRFKSERNR
jgi:hypothetical protein